MALAGLDLVAVSRSLAQVVAAGGERIEAYFERLEVVEVPAGDRLAGAVERREQGLAIRLARGGESWMASVDSLAAEDFQAALRQVSRSWPQAARPAPEWRPPSWPERDVDRDLLRLPAALNRALRRRLVAFPLRLAARRHRRWLQLVGPQLIPEPESEAFYSLEIEAPWGRRGVLTTTIDEAAIEEVAGGLVAAFEAREAASPSGGEAAIVLSPQAAAIFLHEAVAHALEADTLAAGGRVEAAIGLRLCGALVSVLDDPAAAPVGARRASDDEGCRVERRWLLRDGVVEQPLADGYWAQRSAALLPGAGRRGSRFDAPSPRSTHLVLLPGAATAGELLRGAGLWVPQVTRGRLLADRGLCRLEVPCAYRFHDGELGGPVGPFTVEGRVAELLDGIEAVGGDARTAGAGWCAKGRQRVPVWATTPSLRLGRARVVS